MTPINAAKVEVCAELDALERRIGASAMPELIVVEIEIDRTTGMPRAVTCEERRRRKVLVAGGLAAYRNGSTEV